MELLTGALAGGLLSQEIVKIEKTGLDPNTTKLFIAIDVEAFVDKERFAQRIDDFLNSLREMEPGFDDHVSRRTRLGNPRPKFCATAFRFIGRLWSTYEPAE